MTYEICREVFEMKDKSMENGSAKDLIAYGCIAAAVISVVLGILYPQKIGGAFSGGTVSGWGT